MFVQRRGNFLGGVRHAIWRVLRAGLLAAFIGAAFIEMTGAVFDGGWPDRMFVHLAAVVVALLAGYAVGLTAALIAGAKGMVTAVDDLESAARNATSSGFRVMDDIVDAVDGAHRRANP